ncbi:hypothetical protein BsWGS_08812 [Bradybaena similaris]
MRFIQWKAKCRCLNLLFTCLCIICIGTIITLPLACQILEHSGETQQLSMAVWIAKMASLRNKSYLYSLSDFKSIADAADLPSNFTVPRNKKGLFHYELSEPDIDKLSETLQVFHKIMVKASIGYFLYKDTLLGSYRHHSIIPWNDVINLIVHEKHKENVRDACNNTSSRHRLDISTFRYKFYDISGHVIKSYSWKSPFLDISFYKENSTHLWDITLPSQAPYNKSDIFPLSPRPLLGHLYPGPRDPLRTLQANYNLDDCSIGGYNHTAESKKSRDQVATTRCSSLLEIVPFVQHVRGPGGAWCEEVLTYRGQTVHTFARNSTHIPVC